MVSSDWLDGPLTSGLDDAAAAALREWCAQTETTYRLVRWLTNGRSAATVGVVLEESRRDGARQLVVKLDAAPHGPTGWRPGEFAQHWRAIGDAPGFAERHLTEPVHQPIRVGDGRWFALQGVAGGSLRDLVTLQTLVAALVEIDRPARVQSRARAISESGTAGPAPTADPAGIADACGAVVGSIFREWVGAPQLPSMDVPAILGRQLGERLAPGTALHRVASAHPGATIEVAGEDRPLPNPFALVLDPARTAGIIVPTLTGKAHGDLHVENVLVPGSLRDLEASYRLIDLSRYADDAVLTRDPVHLILHLLARALPGLSTPQRAALIDLLLRPDLDDGVVPGWLSLLVSRVRTVTEEWARPRGLVDLWRDQVPLSLLACALTCLGRKSTRPEDRNWFLRLAAHSAAVFLDQHREGTPSPAMGSGADTVTDTAANTGTDTDTDTGANIGADPDAGGDTDRAADDDTADAVHRRYDFFVSYVDTDEPWAEWIAWCLEEAGYRVLRPAPTRTVGPDPVMTMRDGSRQADRMIVVLSHAYLRSVFGQDEWRTALSAEGVAFVRRLLPVRVEDCPRPVPFTPARSVDLFDLDADAARSRLVRIAGR